VRRAITAFAVTVLLAGPTALAFREGGYFDPDRLAAGIVAWLLVLAALAGPAPLPRRLGGRLALTGLALLAAWSAVSFAWAPLSSSATDALQRLLLYLGALTAAAGLLRAPPAQRVAEPALAAGALVAVGYGLSERLLPGVLEFSRTPNALGRLEQPLTYWNAMGALAALGAVLAARLAGDHTRSVWLRAAAAAGSVPLAAGVWLSFSRGVLAALGIGLLALIALAPGRAQLRAVAALLCTGVAGAAVANAFAGVRGLEGSLADREREGALALAALAALCCLAAVATWWLARAERGGRLSVEYLRLPRRAPAIAAAAIVVLALGTVTLAARDRGHPPAAEGASAARLKSIESNRYEYWDVALSDGFGAEPVRGLGAGGFQVAWLRHRDVPEGTKFAHSLYINTLADLGAVGLALLVLFLGGVAAAAVRAHRLDGAAAAGPIALVVVWAVHNAVDWDWELPALTLFAVVAGGLLLARADAAEPALAADPAAGPALAAPAPVPAR
jgi:hypothetical protein